MMAAIPPRFCASAMACMANVVLPEDSGPKISMIRHGIAAHAQSVVKATRPEGITSTSSIDSSPSFMMEPRQVFLDLAQSLSQSLAASCLEGLWLPRLSPFRVFSGFFHFICGPRCSAPPHRYLSRTATVYPRAEYPGVLPITAILHHRRWSAQRAATRLSVQLQRLTTWVSLHVRP